MHHPGHRAGLAGGAFAIALAASLFAGGAAQAQRALIDTNHQIVINEAGGALETPPLPNPSGPVIAPVNNAFIKGSQATDVLGTLGYSGDVKAKQMGMLTNMEIQRNANGEVGTTTLAGHNQIDLTDILTYTNASKTAPTQILVQGTLSLTDTLSGAADGLTSFQDRDFALQGSMTSALNGIGISVIDGPFSCGFNETTGHCGASNPAKLDFSMILTLGQAQSIDLMLLDQFNLSLTDGNGNHAGLGLGLNASSSVQVGDVFKITGIDGTTPVCGVSIGAVSGANWGSTAACAGGGGGPVGGAVPEPVTWALMICGFGGVGAALRRHRRVLAHA